MRAVHGFFGIALSAVLAVAGCAGNRTPELMNIRSKAHSPDEFAILPTKPLQIPKNLSALPPPTPGGSNLTDPTPDADAVAALGGRPAAMHAGGIPVSDDALVRAASRYGVQPGIRQSLDAADLRYRQKHPGRLLPRLAGQNMYYRAYEPMTLDAYAALARWRAAGAQTPSAPPKTTK